MAAEFDRETLAFYAKEAPVYAASGKEGTHRSLPDFLDRLKPGARILELGCGGGRDSAAMLARGFAAEPTDGVPEIALRAQARIGRPVRVMRFDQLDAIACYDAVWAAASLLHVPRDGLPDVAARIFRALKPGGLHFASFKSGDGDGRDRFGRYFNYPDEGVLHEIYSRSGWSDLAFAHGVGGGYDGRQGPWINLTARK